MVLKERENLWLFTEFKVPGEWNPDGIPYGVTQDWEVKVNQVYKKPKERLK